MAKKVSVIVPVYNGERYLRPCLDSLAAQTLEDMECILVDDGSRDGSGAICDEYAARDSRFRVFHQANVGVSQTGEASLSMQQYIYTNAAPAKKYCMHNATQDFTTLQQGDTGDDVTRLQEKLWELGYLLTDDVKESIGIFHDKTYEAVASAQEAMGYTEPDGVATPEFQCFVFSEYNYFIKSI